MSNGSEYANPNVLVSTDWVAEHGGGAAVRLVEVDVDTTAYDTGHLAGAVGWNWKTDTQDQLRRNLPVRGQRTKTNARTRRGVRRTVSGKRRAPRT